MTRPPDERAVAAVAVAEAAGDEQQAGERERVGVDDPLEVWLDAPRSRAIVGSAMLTIVPSMTTASSERHRTARTVQREVVRSAVMRSGSSGS